MQIQTNALALNRSPTMFPFGGFEQKPPQSELNLRILATAAQRRAIAGLRKLAPMGVEDDLGAGLSAFEDARDQKGFVVAIYRREALVATIRLVPAGHMLTAAERLPCHAEKLQTITRPGNWEVGRLIVDPDERSPEMLNNCLAMALRALIQNRDVDSFYAIASPLTARLWRRFGMRPFVPLVAASGARFFLLTGTASDAATSLGIDMDEAFGASEMGFRTSIDRLVQPREMSA